MGNKELRDDEELIREIIAGDAALFRFLVDRYKDKTLNLAISLIKDQAEAEDILQEAFIKVFRNLHKFNFKSSFSTWLYRIVVNTCYSALKKNKKFSNPIPNSLETREANEDSAIDLLRNEERGIYINAVLKQLKSTEALLLKLHYLEEKSIKEIKEITKMSTSNIKVILHRARKNFHHGLERMLTNEKKDLL